MLSLQNHNRRMLHAMYWTKQMDPNEGTTCHRNDVDYPLFHETSRTYSQQCFLRFSHSVKLDSCWWTWIFLGVRPTLNHVGHKSSRFRQNPLKLFFCKISGLHYRFQQSPINFMILFYVPNQHVPLYVCPPDVYTLQLISGPCSIEKISSRMTNRYIRLRVDTR